MADAEAELAAARDALDQAEAAVAAARENADKARQSEDQKKNGADTPTGGGPVQLATGSFTLAAEDLSYRFNRMAVAVSRTCQSDRREAHSLGPGWPFSYDTRVVRGLTPGAAHRAQAQSLHSQLLAARSALQGSNAAIEEAGQSLELEALAEQADREAALAAANESLDRYVYNDTDRASLQQTGNATVSLGRESLKAPTEWKMCHVGTLQR